MEPLSNIISQHHDNSQFNTQPPQLPYQHQHNEFSSLPDRISNSIVSINDEFSSSDSVINSTPDSEQTLVAIKTMVLGLRDQIDTILRVISNEKKLSPPIPKIIQKSDASSGRVIEGVFNGVKMIGPDGREYHVPPNYASKSKLVEGDMMKLTIMPNGAFIYKQICPIPRKRIVGELTLNVSSGQWTVLYENKNYKVLTASVTFYRGKPGDDAVILIPQDGGSEWGAVENIINK